MTDEEIINEYYELYSTPKIHPSKRYLSFRKGELEKVAALETELAEARAERDALRQQVAAPSPYDMEVLQVMFEKEAEELGFDTQPVGNEYLVPREFESIQTQMLWKGFLLGYRRAFAAHAAEHTLADMAAGLLSEKHTTKGIE